MFSRIDRLNELLKREIGSIILREEGFDRNVLVTITKVDISSDLSNAKVFVSVMPADRRREMINYLRADIYNIQKILDRKLRIRKVPKIIFCEEKQVEEAGRIEELLSVIHKNSEQ
ncbi:30S ribosome-binding factor RbfA [Patescibacteria group bacterium]|nr:30S ribosome-binding factor RbfA [Patescibacteria group bacterium]MBU4162288.1 30S ribosome-binding factor RbfA [Patescibacteria group bacterium]